MAFDFEAAVLEALDGLPAPLRQAMSNVGVPLTERASGYAGALPDRITIFRGPLLRAYGRSEGRLREEVHRTVRHEVAHHFGIDDDRLEELGRY
jgi:predicted Zn-dependent protease with MMP-like domain